MIRVIQTLLASLAFMPGVSTSAELTGQLAYADVHDRAAKSIAIPQSGSHELRVISPTILELYVVSERDGYASRPTFCDWVDDEGDVIPGAIPVASDLEVKVDGKVTAVSASGFKRQVRFAPLGRSNFTMENFLYIELAASMASGATVEVTTPTDKWPNDFVFATTVDDDRWSSAVHVNQVGYETGARKTGHVGMFLGTLGELFVNGGVGFEVIDAVTGGTALSGNLVHRIETGFEYPAASGAPDPYQQVYEADFTGLDNPGSYRLKIPGLGASYPFVIGTGVDGVFARTMAAGMFHQRSAYNHQLPFTRFEDGPGHDALAEIPSNTDRAAYSFLWDWIQNQTGGAITGPTDLLSPYVTQGTINVTGGHHDAGDYSKYTTNVSQMIHALTFAADSFPGVAALDNLGIPESDDAISDILQEAKWEADFLAKLQDADGGFYYAVFPRNRRFDGDVLPSEGDIQIVLPKNIVATAAAVGALADIGSSPAFRIAFGEAAGDAYIAKAQAGWGFLAATVDANNDSNVTAAEIAAGYQKLAFYGDAFGARDELAYAAAAMFAATGAPAYEGFLKQLAPDPSSPDLLAQNYLQLWEGWGSAFRTYAFAVRSGRLSAGGIDITYLGKVEAELLSAGNEVVVRSSRSTYGIALDENPKKFLNPSYVFGNNASFDALVALQLNPAENGYVDAIRYNLNYTAGNNPVNAPFITGIGWNQRREIVSQFSQNDGFVLPPIGIPVGNVQAGMPYFEDYLTASGGNLLQRAIYPNTGGFIYPLYDVWADTFETRGETTVPTLSRGAVVASWLFAQSSASEHEWKNANAIITGVPAVTSIGETVTASLEADIALTGARITWEASGVEPCHGREDFTFTVTRGGDNHVAADVLYPDGRRVSAVQRFAADANSVASNGEFIADAETIALYHFNGDYLDASGNGHHLTVSGGAALTAQNLGWMAAPSGEIVRFSALGDLLQAAIPDSVILPSAGKPLTIEARIFPRAYLGFSVDSVPLIAFYQEYDTGYALLDQKWGTDPKGPVVGAHGADFVTAATWAEVAPPNQWLKLRITFDGGSVVDCYVNDVLIGSLTRSPTVSRIDDWILSIGNMDADMDEMRVSSVVRSGVIPVDTVSPRTLLQAASQAEESFDVSAVFSEPVTGLDAADIIVSNGSVTGVSGAGANYSISVSPAVDGIVEISIVEGGATDSSGNHNVASNKVSVLYAAPAGGGNGNHVADSNTTALYHFDSSYDDDSGNGYHLSSSGAVTLSGDNVAWMDAPSGKVVRFSGLGDSLSVTIPDAAIMPSSGQELSIETRIYPRRYLGFSYGNVPILSLSQNWNSSFEVRDTKWGSPHAPSARTSNVEVVSNQVWADNMTLNQWHHLQILFDGVDQIQLFLNGNLLGFATRQPHLQRSNKWTLELGHFDGDIDELRISSTMREVDGPPVVVGTTDAVRPSVGISAAAQHQINAPFSVTATFSEEVSGLVASKFFVHNGTVSNLMGEGANYSFTVTPMATGVVSISLPDGRVSDAAGNGNVPSNLLEVEFSDPSQPAVDVGMIADSATLALFPMDGDFNDVSGNGHHLTSTGNVTLESDNLSWMGNASGSAARFSGLGDTLTVALPDAAILPAGGQPGSVEAWIYPRAYAGFSFANAPIISLTQEWDASLGINDRKWGSNPYGPEGVAGTLVFVDADTWDQLASPNAWHRVILSYDGRETVECLVDGVVAGSAVVAPNDTRTNNWLLTLGNFNGDIDDVRISSVDRGIAHRDRANGLVADYFAGAEFDSLRFTKIDTNIAFDWQSSPDGRLGNGDFSVRWRGCVVPVVSGNHRFFASTTEGARLWVGSTLVCDNWGAGGMDEGMITLNAGQPETIILETSGTSFPASAMLEWEAAGLARETIPHSQLLVNEQGMGQFLRNAYPKTWGDWVESPRNSNKETTPESDRDADGYIDLLEYALGESPETSVHASPGFRIEPKWGRMDAVYERPSVLEDVRYVVEGSQNMRDWSEIGGDELARITKTQDGMESLRIYDVASLRSRDGESPQFLRLRVDFIGDM